MPEDTGVHHAIRTIPRIEKRNETIMRYKQISFYFHIHSVDANRDCGDSAIVGATGAIECGVYLHEGRHQ